MNADSPKASILVFATPMPAAAAARSFDRTARKRRPVVDRRMLTTANASSTTTTRQKAPNQGLGNLPSPWNPMARIDPGSFGPNFSPANRGGATLAPPSPPDHDGVR